MNIRIGPLLRLLERYYIPRHGKTVRMTSAKNLLGEDFFREVEFVDGFVASFCPTYDGSNWFRNDRSVSQHTLGASPSGMS